MRNIKFVETEKWLSRAKEVIAPPFTQTFSKSPAMYVQGRSPVFAHYGNGAHLFDVDGNRFLDFVMALMPCILGYTHVLTKDCRDQFPIFSLPHFKEVELAELLREIIPCCESVRFGKNGTDVTSAAVRLARKITGRDLILCSGYHGWQDWYISTTWRNAGIPDNIKELSTQFKYNDIDFVEKYFQDFGERTSCLIMEPAQLEPPIKLENGENFLDRIKRLCHKYGVILIFDEVISGFRWSLGGAQEYFGVIPDLCCIGKSMSNGWPISAICGRKDLMDHFSGIHYSGTFFGEVVSIYAAITTIKFIQMNKVVEYLWDIGAVLYDNLRQILNSYNFNEIKLVGYKCWPRLIVNNNIVKSFISQELIKNNILWLEGFNLCFAHKRRHIEKLLTALDGIFSIINKTDNLEELVQGIPIAPRFKVR